MRLLSFAMVASCLISASCKHAANSEAKVFPGEEHEGTPEVFKLTTALGNCTASYIRPNIALTAAHCIVDQNNNVLKYGNTQIIKHNKYDIRHAKDVRRPFDLAVIIFPEPVAKEVLSIYSSPVKSGDSVVMFGYSTNGGIHDGNARMGSNYVSKVEGGLILVGDGRMFDDDLDVLSLPQSGDSGGPLFVNESLAGVASAVGEKSAVYVDLQSETSLEFLKTVLKP